MGTVTTFKRNYRQRKRSYKSKRFEFGGSAILGLAVTVFLIVLFAPQSWMELAAPKSLVHSASADTEMAHFGYCHAGGGYNCVVDGDTIYYRGEKIRIADIDTPETHPPRCAQEAELGTAATRRLQALLSSGPFTLQPIERDEDVYGRKLRIIARGGESIGAQLVDEGLARFYGAGRRSWC